MALAFIAGMIVGAVLLVLVCGIAFFVFMAKNMKH